MITVTIKYKTGWACLWPRPMTTGAVLRKLTILVWHREACGGIWVIGGRRFQMGEIQRER